MMRDPASIAGSKSRISIVIVSYKSLNFIDQCLTPIAHRADWDIILWDNDSGDGIGGHVRRHYPHVRVVESPENLGFAAGNNRAFRHCRGDYVLLLNPDAFLRDAAQVEQLAEYLEAHADVAACGPQLLHGDGSHQVGDAGWRISLPTVLVHGFALQRAAPFLRGLYLTSPSLRRREHVPVDWICGACLMVRRSVIDSLGGLDESSFLYGEDIEWGTRMRRAGWQCHYLPRVKVQHLQGATQREAGQAFRSFAWLDDIARRYRVSGGRWGYGVMRLGLAAGYIGRALIWAVRARILRRPEARERAVIKGAIAREYAAHIWRWPRFDTPD
ncbi:glycosyltransferase family 2 protein [Altericroceibacterium endophyticum]|uniref:Glycosyltransferase n=1 Tax=Altericroceibacterium endophyticum TaxID=1808508 RepID=A0A6I4T2E6_9SPHN|nr:glycosyltransferase family 2 protein [Altericroceibacterium endophyticum]MXO64160.1 glycosyltransferase [Altericroceibacterium endophyticum]